MNEPDYLKPITILLVILGVIFFFFSQKLGISLLVLGIISQLCWSLGKRLKKIEQNIETINNHSIQNDERLHNIEQFIKKLKKDKAS